jgi:predicted dehydrogenase
MYRDFLGAVREGRPPEMSLERAMDDQRLMDQIYASDEAVYVLGKPHPVS